MILAGKSKHYIDVSWNGHALAQSPLLGYATRDPTPNGHTPGLPPPVYLATPRSPSQMGRPGKGGKEFVPLEINKEKCLQFDATAAEPGQMTASVRGTTRAIHTKVKDSNSRKPTLCFTPEEEGKHDIHVKWNGRPIAHSPLIGYAAPAYPATAYNGLPPVYPTVYHPRGGKPYDPDKDIIPLKVNQPKQLPFDASEAGPGALGVGVKGPTHSIPTHVDDRYSARPTLHFTPEEEGKHLIHVDWNGHRVPNSPFVGFATRDATPLILPNSMYHGDPDVSFRSSLISMGPLSPPAKVNSLPLTNRSPRSRSPMKVILSGRGLKEAEVDKTAVFHIDGTQANPELCPGFLSQNFVLASCLRTLSWLPVSELCPGFLSRNFVLASCLRTLSWLPVSELCPGFLLSWLPVSELCPGFLSQNFVLASCLGNCPGFLSRNFVLASCLRTLSWLPVSELCPGFLSRNFVLASCLGTLSWLLVVLASCLGTLSWLPVSELCPGFLSRNFVLASCLRTLSWLPVSELCPGFLSRNFVLASCLRTLSWLPVSELCPGFLSRNFVLASCLGTLSWLLVVLASCLGTFSWLPVSELCPGFLSQNFVLASCLGTLSWLPVSELCPGFLSQNFVLASCLGTLSWLPVSELCPGFLSQNFVLASCCPGFLSRNFFLASCLGTLSWLPVSELCPGFLSRNFVLASCCPGFLSRNFFLASCLGTLSWLPVSELCPGFLSRNFVLASCCPGFLSRNFVLASCLGTLSWLPVSELCPGFLLSWLPVSEPCPGFLSRNFVLASCCPGFLSRNFVLASCLGTLSWLPVSELCPGFLSRNFVLASCLRTLSWLLVVLASCLGTLSWLPVSELCPGFLSQNFVLASCCPGFLSRNFVLASCLGTLSWLPVSELCPGFLSRNFVLASCLRTLSWLLVVLASCLGTLSWLPVSELCPGFLLSWLPVSELCPGFLSRNFVLASCLGTLSWLPVSELCPGFLSRNFVLASCCLGFLSRNFVLASCLGTLSWLPVSELCPGFLSRNFVLVSCRNFVLASCCPGFLSQNFVLASCPTSSLSWLLLFVVLASCRPTAHLQSAQTNIPVYVEPLRPQVFRCSYVPEVPGHYKLYIRWNDRPLKGSPFKVKVRGGPKKPGHHHHLHPHYSHYPYPQHPHHPAKGGVYPRHTEGSLRPGEDVELKVHHPHPSHLAVTCRDPRGQGMPCRFHDNGDGTHSVKMTPTMPGRHVVDIRYNDQHIMGSPYFVDITDNHLPGKVRVWGPGIQQGGLLHRFHSNFWVDTTGAGAGELTVRIMGPKGAFHVKMRKAKQREKLYQCFYDPVESGVYTVHVQWSGQHVEGSPFTVQLASTSDELDLLTDHALPGAGGGGGGAGGPHDASFVGKGYGEERDQREFLY
ncbi:hypothetical protein ACOMHN_021789 [Nucella lapillus]